MVWMLLLMTASALVCHKSCLNSCKNSPSTNCIKACCPELQLSDSSSCSLSCEEAESVYQCKYTCLAQKLPCEENCKAFCHQRADNCEEKCHSEFCKLKHKNTNWVFVIGLLILICVFVVVLYAHISNVNKKVAEDLAFT